MRVELLSAVAAIATAATLIGSVSAEDMVMAGYAYVSI
jgi:hypothetical protein